MLREPSSYHGEERQISENCTRFKKIKRGNNKKKSPDAEHGRTNIKNITQNVGKGRQNLDYKIRLPLRLWSNQTRRRNKKLMYIHRYGRIYWILPFLERILWTGRLSNNLPGTGRQNTKIQTPRLDRRHNCDQRNRRKTRDGGKRNHEETGRCRIQTTPEEM